MMTTVPASVQNGPIYVVFIDYTGQTNFVRFHYGAKQNVPDGMFFVLVILNVIVRCGWLW